MLNSASWCSFSPSLLHALSFTYLRRKTVSNVDWLFVRSFVRRCWHCCPYTYSKVSQKDKCNIWTWILRTTSTTGTLKQSPKLKLCPLFEFCFWWCRDWLTGGSIAIKALESELRHREQERERERETKQVEQKAYIKLFQFQYYLCGASKRTLNPSFCACNLVY